MLAGEQAVREAAELKLEVERNLDEARPHACLRTKRPSGFPAEEGASAVAFLSCRWLHAVCVSLSVSL